MTDKLFRVTLTCDTVVCANSEEEARALAGRDLCDIAHWDAESFRYSARPIASAADVPPVWHAGCQPWGDSELGHRLLRDLLERP